MGKMKGTDESLFRQVPVPMNGAQICAQAPTKSFVHTGAGGTGTSLNRP